MPVKINVGSYTYPVDQHDTPDIEFKGQRRMQRDSMQKRPLLRGSKRWKMEMLGIRSSKKS